MRVEVRCHFGEQIEAKKASESFEHFIEQLSKNDYLLEITLHKT